MRLRIRALVIVSGVMCCQLLLAGCSFFPDGKSYNVEGVNAETEVAADGKLSGKLNDSVDIDAEVSIPDHADWKNVKVSFRDWTEDLMQKAVGYFAKGKTELERHESTTSTGIQYTDGSSLSFLSSASFGYSTSQMSIRQYTSYVKDSNGIRADIDERFPLDLLEDLSKEESVNKVKEVCKQLNINIAEEPNVYVVDAEHAQAVYDSDSSYAVDKKGNPTPVWTTQDEAYVINFRICQDGINITDCEYNKDSKYGLASMVEAVVGREGIICFHANGVYDVTASEKVSGEVCTLSDVVKILASRYYYVQGTGGTNILKISLEYVPVYTDAAKEYILKPYWVCKIATDKNITKEGEGQTYTAVKKVFIDAVAQTVLGG